MQASLGSYSNRILNLTAMKNTIKINYNSGQYCIIVILFVAKTAYYRVYGMIIFNSVITFT